MKKLTIILKLFPIILGAVKAVEEAIPGAGLGRKKLDFVLDIIKQAYDGTTELSANFTWEGLVAAIVPMIAKIVDVHNQLGLFTTSTTSKA